MSSKDELINMGEIDTKNVFSNEDNHTNDSLSPVHKNKHVYDPNDLKIDMEKLAVNSTTFYKHKMIGEKILPSYSTTYNEKMKNDMEKLPVNNTTFNIHKKIGEKTLPSYSSIYNEKIKINNWDKRYKNIFDTFYYTFKVACLCTSFISIYIGILHVDCDENKKFRDYLISMGVDVFILTLYTILYYNLYGTLRSIYNIILYMVCICVSIPYPILTSAIDYSESCMSISIFYIYLIIFSTHLTVYTVELFIALYQCFFKTD